MRSLLLRGALLGLTVTADAADAQQRIAVLSEPGTPVVAAEFLVTTGPLDEQASRAGVAYLSARSVVAPLAEHLDSLGVHLNITPQKDAISFSVIAAPETWEEATETVLTALFREPPDSATVLRERRAIVAELTGRAANPADAATQEIDQAFFGLGHPWGRSTVGTPRTIERLEFADVDSFLRANFTPDRAFAAVVGPVDEAAVREHLVPLLGNTFPAPVDVDPFRPAERPVIEEYNSITTWVSASFSFSETADEEVVRFVAYLAADALSFSPQQRSVYNVSSEVTPRVGGGELRLQVVIPPEESDDWAERVGEVIGSIVREPMPDDVFESHVRRYHGTRLMALIAPEDRAHAAVRQLLVRGRYVGFVPDLSDLTQENVSSVARSLGSPTLVLLGPSL